MTDDAGAQEAAFGRDVAGEYYRTTASRAHSRNREWYEHASAQKMRRMRRWLPTDKQVRVLEIGCGCGEMLFGLEAAGYRNLTGLDYCAEELEEARQFVRATLIRADAVEHLAATEERYDLVIAYNVLEHFRKAVLIEMMKSVRRVLKPGGALIAMVPNAVSPFSGVTRYWDITHEVAFTTNSLQQVALLAGFEKRPEFRECGPVPHGPVSYARFILWRSIHYCIRFYLACEVTSDRGGIYTQDLLVRFPK